MKMDNGWVDTADHRRLHKHGYSVGGYTDKGVAKYVLYREEGNKFARVHEFNSAEELNNMLKLILPPEDD